MWAASKYTQSPSYARRGNKLSAVGMLVAICVTLLDQNFLGLRMVCIVSDRRGQRRGRPLLLKKVELTECLKSGNHCFNGVGVGEFLLESH